MNQVEFNYNRCLRKDGEDESESRSCRKILIQTLRLILKDGCPNMNVRRIKNERINVSVKKISGVERRALPIRVVKGIYKNKQIQTRPMPQDHQKLPRRVARDRQKLFPAAVVRPNRRRRKAVENRNEK